MKKLSRVGVAALAILLILFFLPQITHFMTDYLWFKEMQYQSVFLIRTFAKFVIGAVVFVLVFLLSYLTLHLTTKYQPRVTVNAEQVVNVPPQKTGKRTLVLIPSLFLGLFAGWLSAKFLWENILLCFNQTAANVTEPVFGRDISFYFFNLSLLETIYQLAFFFLFIIFISNLILTFYLQGPNKNALKLMGQRMIYFFIAFLLLLIVGFQLQAANLLFSERGSVIGASYVDLKVTLPMYYLASLACIVSAVTLLIGFKRKHVKLAFSGPILLVVVLVIGTVAQVAVQNFVVKPAEIAKEQPYITNNIQMTNQAYGLENLTEIEFDATGTLTASDLQEESDTLRNIRLIDYRPTITALNQLQSMRLYYKFVDVDIDRYQIDGASQQVYLSARELDQSSLQANAQTWINKYLKYTHGYGAVVTPVNRVTTEGQPELWVSDIPPATNVPELEITRPEIYFGQLTNDYVIVNTKEPEFDYPVGDTNAQAHYEGDAGIPLNFINRTLFSLDKANYKILFSNLITNDSKIVLYRNVIQRVEKIAPFLTFDSDPYLVVDEGRLIWMMDGYTSSDKYPYAVKVKNPYSEFYGENYVRNSVKVTIDAYNGDTKFYIVDEKDPLIRSYAKIFPSLFQPISAMPENLKLHIKYPTALFEVQTEIFQEYHMKDPSVFYNKEDAWSVATEIYGNTATQMEPYYVNMRLPQSEQLEFLLMRPFTPMQKQNMVAWLAARNDGEHYGELVLLKISKQKTVYGPMQIESRISNDSEISQDLTLWDQQGSSVIRSNLLVIPIKDSILYVEPIYLTTDNENSLPEVVRIIVAYKDQIVMAKTLDEALNQLFGEGFQTDSNNTLPSNQYGKDVSNAEIIAYIKESLANAKSSSQNGDWAAYGTYLEQLENFINQLDVSETAGSSDMSDDGAPIDQELPATPSPEALDADTNDAAQ